MKFSSSGSAVGTLVLVAAAVAATPACANARELATARGSITISDARQGSRAPMCGELLVEARDAFDNHLISETQPTTNEAGICYYALTVPAQSAIWLRVQAVLVAGARAGDAIANAPLPARTRASNGSVALRFAVITPTTYFFGPNEEKSISLHY